MHKYQILLDFGLYWEYHTLFWGIAYLEENNATPEAHEEWGENECDGQKEKERVKTAICVE